MKRAYRYASIVLISAISVWLTGCPGCIPDYSSGTRVGVVTKFSEKGYIFKSWEGDLIIALPNTMASGAQPEHFDFSVSPDDKVTVEKVQGGMKSSHRVEVKYPQWAVPPTRLDSDHTAVDVEELQ